MAVLIWSVIEPYDRLTWLLEAFPAILAAMVLVATRKRFALTAMLYILILLHAILLLVGAKYTYARVPLFDWLGALFHWHRNQYDKLGHFAQGFVPAMVARELLMRLKVLRKTRWMFFLVVCICLAISATYELFEWLVALAAGQSAEAFLGTQGDVWDTQSDMLMALLGAMAAQVCLGRWHDRQLARQRKEAVPS